MRLQSLQPLYKRGYCTYKKNECRFFQEQLQFLLSIAGTGQGQAQGRLSLTDLGKGLKEALSPKRAPQRPDEAQLLHNFHGKQAPKDCIAAAVVS